MSETRTLKTLAGFVAMVIGIIAVLFTAFVVSEYTGRWICSCANDDPTWLTRAIAGDERACFVVMGMSTIGLLFFGMKTLVAAAAWLWGVADRYMAGLQLQIMRKRKEDHGMARDAARYRWMRERATQLQLWTSWDDARDVAVVNTVQFNPKWLPPDAEAFDKAMDEAMAEKG